MARKVVRRLTAPVYGPAGELLYQAGDVVDLDADLGPDYRTVLDEIDEPGPAPAEPQAAPDPPPAVPSDAKPESATVRPGAAAGKGAAHK